VSRVGRDEVLTCSECLVVGLREQRHGGRVASSSPGDAAALEQRPCSRDAAGSCETVSFGEKGLRGFEPRARELDPRELRQDLGPAFVRPLGGERASKPVLGAVDVEGVDKARSLSSPGLLAFWGTSETDNTLPRCD
jgi:hypothetical protein